jgi:hypothetical protein
MAELNPIEQKCLTQAMDFIKATADKYSLRQSLEASASDQAGSMNALIGSIAHDKYVACVAKAVAPSRGH